MLRKVCLWIVCLALLMVALPGRAARSADPSPLLTMLGYVPDLPTVRQREVVFADTYAAFDAIPDSPKVRSVADFLAIRAKGGASFSSWVSIMTGVMDYSQLRLYYSLASDTLQLTSLDPFQVRQTLGFGVPPGAGLILLGTFDPAAIGKAFAAQGYMTSDIGNGLTLICSAEGCDTGLKQNLRSRNPANPFGGNLGRKEPLVVTDRLIFNSASYATVEAILSAYQSQTPSLAHAPDYMAATEALTERGTLIQAMFVPVSEIGGDPARSLPARPGKEAAATEIAKFNTEAPPIPPYTLAAMGQTALDGQFVTLVALVYSQESDAQAAAKALPARLKLAPSLRMRQLWLKLIEDRKGSLGEGRVFKSSNGLYVALLPIVSPIPKIDPTGADKQNFASFYVYRLLFEGYTARDLGWLIPSTAQ